MPAAHAMFTGVVVALLYSAILVLDTTWIVVAFGMHWLPVAPLPVISCAVTTMPVCRLLVEARVMMFWPLASPEGLLSLRVADAHRGCPPRQRLAVPSSGSPPTD